MITTYSMLAHGKRSRESKEIIAQLQSREWGLLIMDEVAAHFKFVEMRAFVADLIDPPGARCPSRHFQKSNLCQSCSLQTRPHW